MRFEFLICDQMLDGSSGSLLGMRSYDNVRASWIAFAIAGVAAMVPASPTPFAPSGFRGTGFRS